MGKGKDLIWSKIGLSFKSGGGGARLNPLYPLLPRNPRLPAKSLTPCAGDVERNPGPPKRGGPGNKPKEPTKEEQMKMLQDKVG